MSEKELMKEPEFAAGKDIWRGYGPGKFNIYAATSTHNNQGFKTP